MAGLDTQKTGQLGVNLVERTVLSEWRSRWQAIDGFNDDGIDGLIFLEKNSEQTGQIVHVQVKCTKQVIRGNAITISGGTKKLRRHASRWTRVVGASIIVHVNSETFDAHWCDLRSPSCIRNSQIVIPADQTFDLAAKSKIAELCGTLHKDVQLQHIKTSTQDFSYVTDGKPLRRAARQYYKELQTRKLKFSDSNVAVRFTKDGWRHITRLGRSPLKRLQCLQLLGCIPKIIQ